MLFSTTELLRLVPLRLGYIGYRGILPPLSIVGSDAHGQG